MNSFKTVGLMVGLTLLLIWIGGIFGGKSGMLLAFIIACGMNLGTYWLSDRIILRMYHAEEVVPTDVPELYRLIEELIQKAEMPMPKVYIIPNDTPNAFATGRNPQHAAVAVTRGIMKILSKEELTGVLAHELSHIRHRDILVGTIAATIAGAISMLANMAQWAMIFGRGDDDEGGNLFANLVMIIVAPIAAMLIQMAISRSREYLADEGGAKISGNPRYLAGALKKLEQGAKNIPMDTNPATAHMFIVNPLRGGGLSSLFSTHPPIEKRIERLEAM
ncbi:MAG: zinc metalloprotease HtpX [Pseudomonadota bacterium]